MAAGDGSGGWLDMWLQECGGDGCVDGMVVMCLGHKTVGVVITIKC